MQNWKPAQTAIALVALFATCAWSNGVCAKDNRFPKVCEKAQQLRITNNIPEAIKYLEPHVKHHPDSGALLTELGRCYKAKGNVTQARKLFRQATQVDPSYPDSWYEFGAVQENDQIYAEAAEAFKRYLELEPDSDKAGSVRDRIASCKSKI